jgi:eukaryotic-like serine/threonine-protein kinase
MEPISTLAAGFSRPQLSPDGRRIAVTVRPEASRGEPAGIAVIDLDRNSFSQLTRSREWGPLWSADGSQVLFMQQDGMGRVRADGSAPIERLHNGIAYPQTITPDRTTLLFGMTSPDSGSDIWTMRLEGDHTARPLLNSPANEAWAALSPDGTWLAYGSDSGGRFEVYVQSFPELGPRQQVSVEGGDSPLWSRNGRELFFRSAGAGVGRMNAVDVTTGPSGITFGKPHQLFEGRFGFTGSPTGYDTSPDGRFLMTETLDPPKQPVTQLRIVLNWFEVLRRAQTLSK